MEVPTTVAGRIEKIMVKLATSSEGQVIAVVEIGGSVGRRRRRRQNRRQPRAADDWRFEVKPAPPKTAPAKAKAENWCPAAPTSPPRRIEVRVPDIGDAKDVVVVEVNVKAGQTVSIDDLLMVVESDKASMEIPAPVAGRIVSVDVEPGAGVNEGTLWS